VKNNIMSKEDKLEKEGNGRLKILEAASEIFAAKGFDGARVDEIAKKAGVNKALIYYHFESKDKILDELFKKYIDETIQKKLLFMNTTNLFDPSQLQGYVEKNLALMKEDGGEIFKIAVVEALKNSNQNDSLYKMTDLFFENILGFWSKKGIDKSDEGISDLLINAFFFGLAPVMFYITLGDKWAEYYHVDKEHLQQKFISLLNEYYSRDIIGLLLGDKK
jgi:AcrR family transcriptional regulator